MSDDDTMRQIEQLQVELADEKEVSRIWFRKYRAGKRQLEECRREISYLQKELGSTWQPLAAAEALNAQAAAGPIMDDRIKELEQQLADAQGAIKTYIAGLGELSAERDRYKREFEEAHLECRNLRNQMRQVQADAVAAYIEEHGPDPQPEETALERRAWELFTAAMATEDSDITPERSFSTAAQWMAHRDKRRKAGTP